MRHTHRIYLALCIALLGVAFVTGCNSAKPRLPAKEIEITGNDQMRFNIEMFDVKAGQEVKIVFKNVGTMPKESMGHNLVVLELNTDAAEFVDAGFTNASNDYIAPEMEKKIIARTKTLGPGEIETITFTAPKISSQYDFLCTFPGHFAAGMKGKMIVQ